MKRAAIFYFTSISNRSKNKPTLFGALLLVIFLFSSCNDDPIHVEAGFEDMLQMTIYDYIIDSENKEEYSSFLQILQAGKLDKTLSAYNPRGIGYTLFLPDNDAITGFIENNPQFNSLSDLLQDTDFASEFSRYHIVNMAIHSTDFPFGALHEKTLSDDFLTIGFFVEEDSAFYKINNQATITLTDIEASNGMIHKIESALEPITITTYQWLGLNENFSIFRDAVDITGFKETLDLNPRDETSEGSAFTLLVEPNSVYHKRGIFSVEDLIKQISPENQDYSHPGNPLYNFVGYHLLTGHHFLDRFVDNATNFTTYGEVPLNINGMGIDIHINRGKQVFDTIVSGNDTTYVDYTLFDYDNSNVLTQSGVIHLIDQVLRVQPPSRAILTYSFWEEPLFSQFRQEIGSHLIEEGTVLSTIEYSGADLFFIMADEGETNAWSRFYLRILGDFEITYKLPPIVQGRYRVLLRAERFNTENAVIEVFIDGRKFGGLVDLGSGGSANNPFQTFELGNIDFTRYEPHKVTIRSLIPGRFLWDAIRFEPI